MSDLGRLSQHDGGRAIFLCTHAHRTLDGLLGQALTAHPEMRMDTREHLGICLGMQVAVIEYARNVLGLNKAHSTEFNPKTPEPVIALITEWKDREGNIEVRDENADLGGTMRLGAQTCKLVPGTISQKAYGVEHINERHRHRFEFNNNYLDALQNAGLVISGVSVDNELVEMIELSDHPWFVACQFHPEFTSRPREGHPLFNSFVNAALKYKQGKSSS